MPRPSSTPPRATVRQRGPSADGSGHEAESRHSRRKRATRERLLEAALRLMAERGMQGVAINEITAAADVGFGSFYNHFESKEAIYEALLEQVFEDFGDALDRLVRDVQDPAEAIAHCIRHTLLRARREPLWGQFLLREGYSPNAISRGLGRRLLRDIGSGVAAKRLQAPDLLMSFIAAGGIVLAAIAADQLAADSKGPAATLLSGLGVDTNDIPERTAAMVLVTLGLKPEVAAAIARKPLPVTEPAPAPG